MRPLAALDEVLEQLEERRLGPVEVVDHEQQRRRSGLAPRTIAGTPTRSRAGGPSSRTSSSAARRRRRGSPDRLRVVADELPERPVRDALAVGGAAGDVDVEAARAADHLAREARLADAGRADAGRRRVRTWPVFAARSTARESPQLRASDRRAACRAGCRSSAARSRPRGGGTPRWASAGAERRARRAARSSLRRPRAAASTDRSRPRRHPPPARVPRRRRSPGRSPAAVHCPSACGKHLARRDPDAEVEARAVPVVPRRGGAEVGGRPDGAECVVLVRRRAPKAAMTASPAMRSITPPWPDTPASTTS